MTLPLHPSKATQRLAALLLLTGTLMPAIAQIPMATEQFSRRERFEVYGVGQYLHSDDIDFRSPYGDFKLKMDDTGLGGLGFAFHFNDFLSLHSDLMFGGATFSGTVPTLRGGTLDMEQDVFLNTGRLNLDYNIINRRITPFVTAGIGYQFLESELKNRNPDYSCYWDPWWGGWVCYEEEPYNSQVSFTWNAGAGLRWNVTDALFMKATVGATWLQYDGADGITTQLEAMFAIGVSW